jgi:cytochrome c biogenesis protein CcmG/thiol:disulfide interchange protein DsbE
VNSRKVLLAALAVVVAVVAMAAAFAGRFGEDPRAVASPLVGKPAPSRDLELLDEDGTLSLDEMRGEVVVVNFWASWCVPCRAEHGELSSAAQRYRSEGVTFVGIVYQDTEGAARDFLDRLGRPYVNVSDPGSRAAIDFGLFGVPETFVIDREGIVRTRHAGPVTMEALSASIDPLL